MKKLTFTLMLFFAASAAFAQSTMIAKQVADWERAKKYTQAYLDAMPDDGYALKPTPEIRSFAGQMDHIADANFAFVSAASGKKSPFEGSAEKMTDQSKAAVSKAVMDSYDFVISTLKGMTEADLAKDVKVFGMDMKAGAAFEKAFEHQTHHRGQSTVYIRLKGATPPNEMLF
ncbi:DinB family protein [Dyadobacter fanqingshengii]|uniref:DinB family protein n=1 Tax=Dyadobacter fanqingshengii TaxID=2906443 RepID=A0A9X1P764_9BACT|nr:DinB family protein [Dyadobacter fanqingshengii]MCF0039295.1 DinB family protein [Dyadobacter fanqingshengii]MCF2503163.1 DinB family protein [Dyadobacter fanqingshengii]USJ33888.1 DinB family protein [Dyadobacter fanqingshengii]